MKYGIDTRCQHLADDNKDEIYGAISYPIYQSATFARDRVGGGSGYDYSRLQNPTREHLEKIVACLLYTSFLKSCPILSLPIQSICSFFFSFFGEFFFEIFFTLIVEYNGCIIQKFFLSY